MLYYLRGFEIDTKEKAEAMLRLLQTEGPCTAEWLYYELKEANYIDGQVETWLENFIGSHS